MYTSFYASLAIATTWERISALWHFRLDCDGNGSCRMWWFTANMCMQKCKCKCKCKCVSPTLQGEPGNRLGASTRYSAGRCCGVKLAVTPSMGPGVNWPRQPQWPNLRKFMALAVVYTSLSFDRSNSSPWSRALLRRNFLTIALF